MAEIGRYLKKKKSHLGLRAKFGSNLRLNLKDFVENFGFDWVWIRVNLG